MKTKFNPRQLFGLILGNFLWKCSIGMLLVLSLFSSIAAAQVKSCVQTALPLSPEAQSDLSFMIEEEKVAGDLYGSFYLLFESKIFSNIESSERNHEGALREVLNVKYPEVEIGTGEFGEFENSELQDLYNTLLSQGTPSLTAALTVGALVEETDIQDLRAAIKATSDEGLICVYRNLLRGSKNHLRAFVRQLQRVGVRYTSQVLRKRVFRRIVRSTTASVEKGNGKMNGQGFGKRW